MNFPLKTLGSFGLSKTLQRAQPTGSCDLDGKLQNDGQRWVEQGLHAKGLGSNKCMECNCKVSYINATLALGERAHAPSLNLFYFQLAIKQKL